MQKRGLSQIITTVIIILIGILAVFFIWAVIQGVITRASNQAKLNEKCGFLDLKFDMLTTGCTVVTTTDPSTGAVTSVSTLNYSIARGTDSVSPMKMTVVIGTVSSVAAAPGPLTSSEASVTGTYKVGDKVTLKVVPMVGLGTDANFVCASVKDEQIVTCQEG